MPKKIISKEKVLQVYPDAQIKSNKVYWVVAGKLTFNKTLSEPQAWYSAWKSINAEQKRINGKENKEQISVRIKPSAIKAITSKYGSVQKWVDSISKDFLTK
jgi:hypothetical protein